MKEKSHTFKFMLKYLLGIFILLSIIGASCKDVAVSFAWTPSAAQDVDGYSLANTDKYEFDLTAVIEGIPGSHGLDKIEVKFKTEGDASITLGHDKMKTVNGKCSVDASCVMNGADNKIIATATIDGNEYKAETKLFEATTY